MASYKVIQDIEAEDKLLGPLTLRQFIYAFIAGCLIFLCYFVASHGAAFLIVLFLPFIAIASFFAFPWNHEQSTEIWALARIRFLVMPRKRIWDQSGLKELVKVNVPKRAVEIYTDGLSQNEVKSRLKILAKTIDSRGWVIKSTNPYVLPSTRANSDRLLEAVEAPQEVPDVPVDNVSDILEPDNTVANKFDTALQQREQARRQQLIDFIDQPEPQTAQPPTQQVTQEVQQTPASPADSWFMNLPQEYKDSIAPPKNLTDQQFTLQAQPTIQTSPAISGPVLDEESITKELRAKEPKRTFEYSHLPTILPLAEAEKLAKQQAAQSTPEPPQVPANSAQTSAMTDKPDAAILGYVDRDDLTIGVIEHQVNKPKKSDVLGDDEVVISLH